MTSSAASTSSTSSSNKLSPQAAQKALAYLRRAIEKMKALQATERVIAAIERIMLNRLPEKVDLAPLVHGINELNLSLRAGEEDPTQANVALVSEHIDKVVQVLAARDASIMPYHLRRFCEEETTSLDLNALAALTSFYRSLPPSDGNRGKYDFVVTRLFSIAESGHRTRHRHLRISREQVAKRLSEMCMAWGENIAPDPAKAIRISQHIHQFDQFIEEAKQIHKFEELVSRAFFQRIRDFKAEVGVLLYLPEITAASIESNLVINNRFLTLLELESEEMQAALPSLQNLADAFSDTYSNEPSEIAGILEDLQSNTPTDQISQDRLARLTRLLQIPIPQLPAPPLSGEMEVDLPLPPMPFEDEFNAAPESLPELPASVLAAATIESDDELKAFAAEPENQPLVMAYLNASADVRKLNLHSFLSPLPDGSHDELPSERKLRRVALSLIFQADQIVQSELAEGNEANADLPSRVDNLFDQLGQMSDEVRDQIKAAAKREQNANYEVLLDAYNQLMTARLRLQSALVRRNIGEGAEASVAEHTPQRTTNKPVQEAVPSEEKAKRQALFPQKSLRTWLIVAVIISSVIALGMHFVVGKKQKPKDDVGVERVDRSQIPAGEFFTDVKLHQELMICAVEQKWLELPVETQKAKLQELFTFGQTRGVNRILLINVKGKTVGFMTKEECYLN